MNDTMSAEASVLHAALDDETDEMLRLLRDFLPGERRALRMAAALVYDACDVLDTWDEGSET